MGLAWAVGTTLREPRHLDTYSWAALERFSHFKDSQRVNEEKSSWVMVGQ